MTKIFANRANLAHLDFLGGARCQAVQVAQVVQDKTGKMTKIAPHYRPLFPGTL